MQVFVWFGVNSTEIEKKLAVKSAQVCVLVCITILVEGDLHKPAPPLHTHHTHTTHRSISITYRNRVRSGNWRLLREEQNPGNSLDASMAGWPHDNMAGYPVWRLNNSSDRFCIMKILYQSSAQKSQICVQTVLQDLAIKIPECPTKTGST